jgi:hypothetical protein
MILESQQLEAVLDRLGRIEACLANLLEQRVAKEFYSTAEVAAIVGRAEYSVREWCRQGRVAAQKNANGRGWLISNDELIRIRNLGPDPIAKYGSHRVLDR